VPALASRCPLILILACRQRGRNPWE
jgi:hypothetical protein